MLRGFFIFGVLVALSLVSAQAAESSLEYDENDIYARMIVRTADQLAAFYIGREFSKAAVDEILKVCLVTPIIKNRLYDVMWIELDSWEFSINGIPFERLDRSYWKQIWSKTDLALRHQATFGWTLMPEKRDLRQDEGVGGSVVVPWQTQPFRLVIRLPIEHKGEKFDKELVFEGLKCTGNQ